MRTAQADKPDVSAEYAQALLQWLMEQGMTREEVLGDSRIASAQLTPGGGRLTTLQDACLLANAVDLSGNPGLGYELGLQTNIAQHGVLGYTLMSCGTLRSALEYWAGFLCLRTSSFEMRLTEEDAFANLHIRDLTPWYPMRSCAQDRLVAMTMRLCQQIVQDPLTGMELHLPGVAPACYAAYRERLVPVRFGMPACALRFPRAHLDRALPTASPVTQRLLGQQCERERSRLGRPEDIVVRLKDLLEQRIHAPPTVDDVAEAFCMSTRTLKRRLQRHGFSFRAILDEVRKREVLRHMSDPGCRTEAIAHGVGYADSANFARAFRRWTGETPGAYRTRLVASSTASSNLAAA